MPWVEIFTVFLVSHVVGDFLLQTEWQATHKHGGLGPDPEKRRALLSHGATYTIAYVPAYVWLAGDLGAGVVLLALLISLPHIVQDDGRLILEWSRRVKHVEPTPPLAVYVDQSFHVLVLFLTALVCGS